MTQQPTALDDPGFLCALLNLVIPPEGAMPGAGDLELWPSLAAVLGRNAPAFASITAGLNALHRAALDREPGGLAALPQPAALELLRSIEPAHPDLIATVARMSAMAYYQHPTALEALGEPARPPFPEGFELEPMSPEWLTVLANRAQPRPRAD